METSVDVTQLTIKAPHGGKINHIVGPDDRTACGRDAGSWWYSGDVSRSDCPRCGNAEEFLLVRLDLRRRDQEEICRRLEENEHRRVTSERLIAHRKSAAAAVAAILRQHGYSLEIEEQPAADSLIHIQINDGPKFKLTVEWNY